MTADFDKVFDVVVAFSVEKDYYRLLEVILNKMMEITNADGGTLYVLEDKVLYSRIMRNQSLNFFRAATDPTGLTPITLDEHNIENVSACCAINNEIILIDDIYDSEKFNFTGPKNFDKSNDYRTKSMLVLPLTATGGDGHEVISGTGNKVIGVIQLINAIDRQTGKVCPFGPIHDPPVLPALANIAANTLANIKFSKEVQDLFDSFVRVMTSAIDERSHYNSNHTNNVARYCGRFVDYLNTLYPPEHPYSFTRLRREQLALAALLHDIGKIITPLEVMDKGTRLGGHLDMIRLKFDLRKCQIERSMLRGEIDAPECERLLRESDEALALVERSDAAGFLPDETLEKLKQIAQMDYVGAKGEREPIFSTDNIESLTVQRGTLTTAERRVMQEHVSITERLLGKITFSSGYRDVVRWAGAHHEFMDGTGYPEGLKSNQIPMEAAILTIADIYDALTADDRPYKKAMPAEKAAAILRDMASEGKLHPELTELFLQSKAYN